MCPPLRLILSLVVFFLGPRTWCSVVVVDSVAPAACSVRAVRPEQGALLGLILLNDHLISKDLKIEVCKKYVVAKFLHFRRHSLGALLVAMPTLSCCPAHVVDFTFSCSMAIHCGEEDVTRAFVDTGVMEELLQLLKV